MRFSERRVGGRGTDADHQLFAGDPDGHVAVHEEREAAEHGLLCDGVHAGERGSDLVRERVVVGHERIVLHTGRNRNPSGQGAAVDARNGEREAACAVWSMSLFADARSGSHRLPIKAAVLRQEGMPRVTWWPRGSSCATSR